MRRKIDKIHLFIIIISLCIISFSLSIVYAALGSVLTMTTSKVTQSALTWNMGIQSGSITGVATGNITEMECGTATATTSQITGVKMKLTKTGDKCTYAFNLKNSGSIGAKITSIFPTKPQNTTCTTATSSTLICGNITYRLRYNSGSSNIYVSVNDIINPNTTKTVYLTAEYTGADAADDIFQNQFGFTISFGQK